MTARAGRRSVQALLVVLAAVLLVVLFVFQLLDRSVPILYYRAVDQRTLVVGVVSGPGTWTRATAIQEGSDTVTLTISLLRAPLPGIGDDLTELTITLRDPIGDRSMIDSSSGLEVPRTRCLPPAYLAAGCT